MGNVTNVGSQEGYETTISYGSLYNYFNDAVSGDVELYSFHGDEMPYVEKNNWATDFWTGYYTS